MALARRLEHVAEMATRNSRLVTEVQLNLSVSVLLESNAWILNQYLKFDIL